MNGENQEAQSGLRIIGVGIAIGLVLFMGSVGYAKWHAQPSRHLEPLLFILNFAPYIGVAIILLLGIAKAVLERLASKNNTPNPNYAQRIWRISCLVELTLGISLGMVVSRLFVYFHLI